MSDASAPLVTKSGRVLTDADVQALADEAERGYDVKHLRPRHRCRDCGLLSQDVTLEPCPYASEIHGDETPVPLCQSCRHERSMDI